MKKSLPLTDQQQHAIDATATGQTVVIVAGAGAGKTSTLQVIAEKLVAQGKVGAYICYNASTAKEAKGRFPKGVTCGTAHSFATNASRDRQGVPYWHHRLRGRKTGRGFQNARTVARILGVNDPLMLGSAGGLSPDKLATIALNTVKAFCKTDAAQLAAEHVRVPAWVPQEAEQTVRDAVLPIAARAWEDLRLRNGLADNPSAEGCLNVEHDHYLKRWQLSGRAITVRGPGGIQQRADFVMFDECQDANPVMAAVFKAAGAVHGSQLILVGDRNQAINGWNGAVDIMGDFPDAAHVELTRSFRFGPAIATEANKWLTLLDSPLRIQGFDQVDSRVGPLAAGEAPDAVLCRTNAGAMRAVLAEHAAERKVYLVGDGEEMKALAKAAIDLDEKGRTFHADLKDFTSWRQVVDYCEQGELGSEDLETGVKLIEEFEPETIIEAIEQLVDARVSDVTVCTAHKSKGLEWPVVRIGDDFHAPREDEDGNEELPGEEELMLSYVAVTRAKERLDRGSLSWVDGHAATHRPAPAEAPTLAAVQAAEEPADAVAEAVARVAAAGDPLARAVALLALQEARAAAGEPRDDAERAAAVRAIVAAYTEQEPAAVLAETALARTA